MICGFVVHHQNVAMVAGAMRDSLRLLGDDVDVHGGRIAQETVDGGQIKIRFSSHAWPNGQRLLGSYAFREQTLRPSPQLLPLKPNDCSSEIFREANIFAASTMSVGIACRPAEVDINNE